jgi:hypothetical protein
VHHWLSAPPAANFATGIAGIDDTSGKQWEHYLLAP